MFKGKKESQSKKRANGTVETLIGKGTRMSGLLQAEGTIRVEGEFEGDINTKSDVIIGGEANVNAVVKGENVTLSGKLEGSIEAAQLLEIRANGTMLGDISVGNLVIEDGAYFSGNCQMKVPSKENESTAREEGKEKEQDTGKEISSEAKGQTEDKAAVDTSSKTRGEG